MSMVDYPDMKSVAELGPEEYLLSFYEQLGWDRKSDLDPTKIAINQQHWLDVCKEYNDLPGPGIPGYLWMNSGPTAEAGISYGKIDIGGGAFQRDENTLSPAEIKTLDNAIRNYFTVEGNTVYMDADYRDTNEFLLQSAYDARAAGPETYMEILRGEVSDLWMEGTDLAIDEMVERSGIALPGDPLFQTAHDYVMNHYSVEPPYSHYFDQDMKVNIILGTKAEANLDFGSVRAMCDYLNEPGMLDAESLDNGITWLVKQQGYSLDDLKSAVANFQKWGFDACEITHGTFLASVAEEMCNFPNYMGAVTVLTNLSMTDLGKTLGPNDVLTVSKDSTIGIFAPWVGGGSGLDIQLEKDLDIPADMRFDIQIEGANCQEYTVNQVYGLVDEAWKEPTAIKFPQERPLNDLLKEAHDKAAQKNIGHLNLQRNHKPPELGL